MRELSRIMPMAGDYRITSLSIHYDTAKPSDLMSSVPLRITFDQPIGSTARRALFVPSGSRKDEAAQDLASNFIGAITAHDKAYRWSLVCVAINGHGMRLQIIDNETTQLHEYRLEAGDKDVVLQIHALDRMGMTRKYTYHEHTVRGRHIIAVKEPAIITGGPSQNLSFEIDRRDGSSYVTSVEII